ncbi:MAG: ADP-forming succinate--CoA ligase subunit beta [Acidiferrobacteraceae bacterium]
MWIHEYQAKALLARCGIVVPRGALVRTVDEAVVAARTLGGDAWVLKAQVHAGGRGKAGGVRIASDPNVLAASAAELLGTRLVTAQTGPDGAPIDSLLIEEAHVIQRELYAACVLDRGSGLFKLLVSDSGGVNIEQAVPQVQTLSFEPDRGADPFACRKLAYELRLPPPARARVAHILWQLHRLALQHDLTLVEINPLVLTGNGDVVAVDAKIEVDDNALYRHPDLEALRDTRQEEPREARARSFGLSFVALKGDIGCLVNGAGLAMATMDLICLHGGAPANFLDVGGSATSDRVAQAFELITSGAGVRAVLVNIFGGIVRCDLIAEGILGAVRKNNLLLPVVVRLEGTRAEEGRQVLASSGLSIIAASGLEEAAQRAVAAARAGG